MKLKKPSIKGMKNVGYLGHFSQDKFIQQGHNDSGTVPYRDYENPEKRQKMYDDEVAKRKSMKKSELKKYDKKMDEVLAKENNMSVPEYKYMIKKMKDKGEIE